MRFRRVAVLLGGLSAERQVSLSSGEAVAGALERAGREVVRIDVDRELDRRLREASPDAAFIALHGRFGEDGCVQGLLELLGIPYTGSGVLASALAMDKARTRDVLAAAGIPVARGAVLEDGAADLPPGLELPVVVKPVSEGSSVGVSIVHRIEDLSLAIAAAQATASRVLIEAFVAGAEVNVAVLDGRVLGAVEIVPNAGGFYDFAAKYDKGGSTHHIPPRLPAATVDTACDLGRRAFLALGCAGAARVDLIVPERGNPVVLEVNTIPGMTATSLLPEIAAAAGIPFEELVALMVDGARLRVAVF
ncbi:MAG TPA: D-alanine--D-alanine ligase [Polyangia bacterium]|nr:D-alanine--D-alanine ligase [Polyangia bacterium]